MDTNGTELGNCTQVTANTNTLHEALGQQRNHEKRGLDTRGRHRHSDATRGATRDCAERQAPAA